MKRITILAMGSLAVMTALAQSKTDIPASVIINATKDATIISRSVLTPVKTVVDVDPERKYSVIVTLDKQESLEGYDVIARRGDMAIVRLTAAEMETVAAMASVKQLSLGTEDKAMMNNARKVAGVDAAHSGVELGGTKYTGAGVIAGMMDKGVDINHINFLDADGQPRASSLWTVRGADAIVSAYQTPDRIRNFSTDNTEESHGTHVLGIMAGSYNGPADYGFYNDRGGKQTKKQTAVNSAIPYYGVATESELAVSCGDFSNNNVEVGAELVADYAASKGMPCVINISIGNTIGPHDGTDAKSRWLESIGKDAIVCIAAGNEGDVAVYLPKTFTAADNTLRSVVTPTAGVDGAVDIWGSDDSVFKVSFGIINTATKEIVYSYNLDKNLANNTITITGSAYNAPGYLHDPNFEKAFGSRGAVMLTSNIDVANNRYEVRIDLQLAGSGTSFLPVIAVEGKAGQHVDCYANGSASFRSAGLSGYSDGDSSCSINGLACGKNVLVVGSYNNVNKWVTSAGREIGFNSPEALGGISSFSSYGTTFDGRRLPDVCGPGGGVIASYSKYYVENTKVKYDLNSLVGRYTGKTRVSYWDQMSGTSMATPFVSGVIATWLQADPTLTISDIKDIIARTATNDESTAIESHRWGAGKINALAGLKDILGLSGISDVKSDEADVFVSSSDNRNFEIQVIGSKTVTAEAYSLAGTKVASADADSNTASLSLDGVAPGVYILRITTESKTETHKIAVR